MTIGTDTAATYIKTALRRVNAYQSGDQLAQPDSADCLEVFNDLLDSLSASNDMVFGVNENVLTWTSGKNTYSVGNPANDLLGYPNFTGTLSSGSPTITGVTNMPANLVAGATAAYAVGSGSILTDTQGLVPANTTVLAFNAGAQTVTMSANALNNSNGADSFAYTVPGDFPIPRPIRITTSFTRFNSLDFTMDAAQTEEQYNAVLYKAQAGPWPIIGWYNYTFPYGQLKVYQTPGNSSEFHLFTQTILGNVTINQILVMPQGYARALKWLLAKEIWTEYRSSEPLPAAIAQAVYEAMLFIKAANKKPQKVAQYESELSRGNRPDGGWITHGGYR
jgi:hypothetical protein